MVQREELEQFLNEYLNSDKINDYSLNGLQVEGKNEIENIITGVSANLSLINTAIEKNADAILVHHGLLWTKMDFRLKGVYKNRITKLLEHNINLFAYHLPLDLHPEVGNNISLIKMLPYENIKSFGNYNGIDIGYQCNLQKLLSLGEISDIYKKNLDNNPIVVYDFGPEKIETVGIISGGAPELVNEAINKKLNLYITGEVTEYVQELCREAKINYIALGHYASEKFGVINLSKKIKQQYQCSIEFVDIKNKF